MRLYREVQPPRVVMTADQVIAAVMGCLVLLLFAQYVARFRDDDASTTDTRLSSIRSDIAEFNVWIGSQR